MNNFEKIKSMTIEELTDWIDKYGQFDVSPWMEWFDKTYCKNCYELQQQLDQLKAKNKHINDLLNQALKELEKTIETLAEIKEIVENIKHQVRTVFEEG